jgi:hypothetical protein
MVLRSIYDPDDGSLTGWRRAANQLQEIAQMAGFVSPRRGIRFEPGDGPDNLRILSPNGTPFRRFSEWVKISETNRRRAEAERQRADDERQRADDERLRAERLRELGIEPE